MRIDYLHIKRRRWKSHACIRRLKRYNLKRRHVVTQKIENINKWYRQ